MADEHLREFYPHKYAIISLGGSVRVYVVSKVYLLKETLTYNIDGSNKRSYTIALPYELGQGYHELEVNHVYTTFESAKSYADELNAASGVPKSVLKDYAATERKMLDLCKDIYVYP